MSDQLPVTNNSRFSIFLDKPNNTQSSEISITTLSSRKNSMDPSLRYFYFIKLANR